MDYEEIVRLFEASREEERLKIVRHLISQGYKVSSRSNSGKGRSDYTSGGTIKGYDLSSWKYINAKKDQDHNIFISLQSFDKDPVSKNRHTLRDRLGIYVYDKYNADEAYENMHTTDIDLPINEEKLKELDRVIGLLVSK